MKLAVIRNKEGFGLVSGESRELIATLANAARVKLVVCQPEEAREKLEKMAQRQAAEFGVEFLGDITL